MAKDQPDNTDKTALQESAPRPADVTMEVDFEDERAVPPQGKSVKKFNQQTGEWETLHYTDDDAKAHRESVGDDA
jgi:hypothetical protein